MAKRGRLLRYGLGALVLVAAWEGISVLRLHARQTALLPAHTCATTGGGTLRVCHAAADEGVYYRPASWQVAYNTQIIALDDGRYATVLHGEARDLPAYGAATHRLRPGDSIKSGVAGGPHDPGAVYHAPADLDWRIWGSLTDPRSLLYDRFDPAASGPSGLSGGGNPMVVRGAAGDPYFYVLYLAVASDGGRGEAWRNILVEARTRDFLQYDLLQRDGAGRAVWVAFAGDAARPAAVVDTAGHVIESSQPARVTGPGDPHHPAGSVNTQGVFGSLVRIGATLYYFYTDQDPAVPTRSHLYVRTAPDIATNGRLSPPRAVLDVAPEMLIRVARVTGTGAGGGGDRWAVFYNCFRRLAPPVSDICLQYTRDLALDRPGGIGGLALFDGPGFSGVSRHALGLTGDAGAAGASLKIQQFYLSTPDGALARPRVRADGGPAPTGGLLTWTELGRDWSIFGAPVYWAVWDVSPERP